MTTIVLADKSNIIRYGLRSLLDVHADFRIIGEAAGGKLGRVEEFLDALGQKNAADQKTHENRGRRRVG